MPSDTSPSQKTKPRQPLPDPRAPIFSTRRDGQPHAGPEYDAATAHVTQEQMEAVPGYKTGNLAAIDAAKTAAENYLAQTSGHVPAGHLQSSTVMTHTNPATEGDIKSGEQRVLEDQETRPNPGLGAMPGTLHENEDTKAA
jgi:hypothetical protein